MKKRLVQTIEENNNTYGQVSNPLDILKAQDYLHERINELTRDFINGQDPEAVGFNYTLGAGNARTMTIAAPGRVYKNGKSYHLPENTTLNIAPSDSTNPRLDLVVAVLDEDVDTAMALIPFVCARLTNLPKARFMRRRISMHRPKITVALLSQSKPALLLSVRSRRRSTQMKFRCI